GAVLLPGVAKPDRELLLLKDRQPLSEDEIRRSLPERTALVQLSVLDDRVLIWLIRRERLEVFTEPVPEEQIRTLVQKARNLAESPKAGKEALAALFGH